DRAASEDQIRGPTRPSICLPRRGRRVPHRLLRRWEDRKNARAMGVGSILPAHPQGGLPEAPAQGRAGGDNPMTPKTPTSPEEKRRHGTAARSTRGHGPRALTSSSKAQCDAGVTFWRAWSRGRASTWRSSLLDHLAREVGDIEPRSRGGTAT